MLNKIYELKVDVRITFIKANRYFLIQHTFTFLYSWLKAVLLVQTHNHNA